MKTVLKKAGLITTTSTLVVLGILILIVGGCAAKTTSNTAANTPAATTVAQAEQTVVLGEMELLSGATGVDNMHTVALAVDADNQNGGLTIGGKKYKIKLFQEDAGANTDTQTAAINKLVSRIM